MVSASVTLNLGALKLTLTHDELRSTRKVQSQSLFRGPRYLTTMAQAHDWCDVWLDDKRANDWSRRWRLKGTDDGVAFLIENATSKACSGRWMGAWKGDDPHMWSSHWAMWQLWIILRLPLT
jgi:hypothetical protein